MHFIGLTPEGTDQLSEVRAHLDDFGITWLNGYGAAGALEALGIRAFPTTIVVGKDGRVVWNDEQGGSLKSALEKALASEA